MFFQSKSISLTIQQTTSTHYARHPELDSGYKKCSKKQITAFENM
jgi:hypothetical protein